VASNAIKGNYILDVFTLTNFDGSNVFNLKTYVQVIEFKEDIYENVIMGKATLTDGYGIPQYLPLVGEELLSVGFKTSDDAATYFKEFRVYKIINNARDANQSSTSTYSIYFCSAEMMINESMRIYRGYKNMLTSDIVSDIYQSYLLNDASKTVNFQVTGQAQQIVIPSLKPLQAMNMLCGYAQQTSSDSGFFLFYENADGFNFVNIETLYSQDSVAEYTVTHDNTDALGLGSTESAYIPMTTNVQKGFDRLQAISNGLLANTVEGFDMLSKGSITSSYSYATQFSQTKHIEPNAYPITSLKNTDTTSQAYKFVNSRSLRGNSKYFIANDTDGVSFSKTYEQYLPFRTSMFLQASAVEIVCIVGGNTDLKAGDVITLNLDARNALKNTETEQYDRYLAGRFLVRSVTHVLSGKYFTSTLLLIKDCYTKAITAEPTFITKG